MPEQHAVFLESGVVNYVPKDLNPTEVPQCRPEEDLLDSLLPKFIEIGWLKMQKLLREEFGDASKVFPQKLY